MSARERLQATVRDGGSVDVAGAVIDHLDLWTGAVTKKSSSGRGSSGKIELTGIKRLRELILELAVRGKLVTQDKDDEPIDLLFEKIESEKSAQLKAKKIRKPKVLPEVQATEQPFPIPESWRYCRLNELGAWGSGATPKRGNAHYYGGGIPWFKSGELYEDFIDSSEETITELALQETSVRMNQPGDVLIAMYGATIGKASILEVAGTTNQAVCACTPWSGISNRFLLLLLKAYRSRFIAMGAGGAQPNISREKIIATVVGLPPEQEQHRIVQKVDELMALCDRLEQQTGDQLEAHETLVDTLLGTLTKSENATELADNWARLAAHFDTLFTTEQSIDKLRQTILQLAVMGRLVEQDAKDEPTTQLLERVSNEKQRLIQSKVLKRTKSLAPLETSALSSIPESWLWVNLGDIISVMDAGWSPACPPRPADPEKWGVLKTTAVQVMKYQEFENKQLPENKTPKEQYEVRSGDILITRAGPKNRVGISCVVKETRDKLMISDKIIRFHLIETGLSEEYICLCLNAGETYNYLEQAKSGMAESQMNISQDKLKAAPVPLCPANEQHRIVQKVDELIALCDQLKERLNQASETRCQLAEAVVEKGLSA